jgi:hypothetical protein
MTGGKTTRDIVSLQQSYEAVMSGPIIQSRGMYYDSLIVESCDRLFLEEFEDLNRPRNMAKEADKKLSYS